MKKEQIETILNDLLATGGDFAEVFYEESSMTVFQYIDHRLDDFTIESDEGVGFRLAKGPKVYTAETNDLQPSSLKNLITELKENFSEAPLFSNIKLNELEVFKSNPIIDHNDLSDAEIKHKLKIINDKIWPKDSRIDQVNVSFRLDKNNVTIANQTGLYKKEERMRTKFFLQVNFKDGENKSSESYSKGTTAGFEFMDDKNIDEIVENVIQTGLDKLYAKPCIGGDMPVILNSGFGGVLFHEACGHAMEATSVATHQSVLADDLNHKIASSKVTIIDDGTISSEWGTTHIDDEGKETQKNILIQDGILISFLVDELNSRKMKCLATGSSRRENYSYPPTSRMNNTYLAPGTDKKEDMFKDIVLGLYAVEMGGGCVDPETGDFNFNVKTGYMIRDGKIGECVKSASLLGNTKELLNKIEMVSDDLQLDPGYCGSRSGWVPVNVGQPTVKISHILVGGEKNEGR